MGNGSPLSLFVRCTKADPLGREGQCLNQETSETIMPLRFSDPASGTYQFPLTIRHLLDGALDNAANQQIIYRDKSRYTYRDFVGRVGRLANLLKGMGAESGTSVAVMDWDSHRYLEAYFAIPMMGAVLQTVNVRLPMPQIAYTLRT